MQEFQKISPEEIQANAIKLIGKDWMLITAGNIDDYNTMTAAWGGIGFLWNKPVVYTFIRPQRHTFQYTEKRDHFTLSFFEEKYRDVLQYCGKYSGRDVNKAEETNITAIQTPNSIAFQEANLIIECKNLYKDYIKKEAFLDTSLVPIYKNNDYHMMYIAEIMEVYKKSK